MLLCEGESADMEEKSLKKSGMLASRHSVQTKLIGIITVMLAIILLVNLYIFSRINAMIERIDSVFASNVSIGELTDSLEALDGYVYEYLSTKSSSALENYYRYAQDYKELAEQLNGRKTDNAQLMLEKNIRGMSLSYLDKAEEAVQAKRGRNVERYRAAYEDGRLLLGYINSYIYELNTLRFSENSARYQYLLSVMNVLEVISLLIIAALFVITLIGIILIVRSMIGPMTTLAAAAGRVAEGDLGVEVPVVDSRDEIGVVSSTFNQMVVSIRTYIQRVRENMQEQARMKERELSMEANLKEAQLNFLQAQINPHFLFNSLNAGAQLAMMEEADATGQFLEKMADFFRYNVKRTSDSTLAEEIGLVDTYMYILNVRFAGDITYRKQIAPEVGKETVPAMILQPLVENAITHGIREMTGDGVITLGVDREEEGFIRVSVTDNGVGMSAEQIAKVFAKAEGRTVPDGDDLSSETGSTGIGLENVIRRLRLFYGRDDILSIHSEGHMMGTEVTLLLPAGGELRENETLTGTDAALPDKDADPPAAAKETMTGSALPLQQER